jgi:hypothetical protein
MDTSAPQTFPLPIVALSPEAKEGNDGTVSPPTAIPPPIVHHKKRVVTNPVFLLILIAIIITVLSQFIAGLGFTTAPAWTPVVAFTNDTLTCTWANNTEETYGQNITLLNNSVLFNTTFENASLVTLSQSISVPASQTRKGERWTCRITLQNSTDTYTREANITIANSPPTTEGEAAGIFIGGTDIGYIVQVTEDQTYAIDVNATDEDGDTLTYLAGDAFCTRTSSTLGTYTCAPTQAHLTGNLPTQTNITFTVTDGQNVGGRTVTFNITPVNEPPVLTLANHTTAVNTSKNMTFSVSDEETNTPYSFIMTAPAEISDKLTLTRLNAAGSSFSVYYDATVQDPNDVGLWSIMVNVTDNSTDMNGNPNNASSAANFTLNITAVGRRPYFLATSANISPDGNGIYQLLQGQSIRINITANDSDVNASILFFDDTARFAIATINSWTNTSAALGQINFTPTNSDVGRYNVTITILDEESLSNTTVLQFNVTDVNEPPTVHEISVGGANTLNNTNASNLTARQDAPFVYVVNATDPDTINGDTLTFSDNTTLFAINASTGRISFTPNASVLGEHSVNITVTDTNGSTASRRLNITVLANTPPRFTASPLALNCSALVSCSYNLSANATDDDLGDSVILFTITNLTASITDFAYNNATGVISFTPPKLAVGNYTLNITITDSYGATNSTTMNVSINNTPEAPILTSYDFSSLTMVETYLVTYQFQATDQDFLLSENVTFTTNLSINHTITPLATVNTTARAVLSFTPSLGQNGTYSVRINATDSYGLIDSEVITITINPKLPPPQLLNFTPWGLLPDNAIQTSYINTSHAQFSDSIAEVNLTENTVVLFNVTMNDTRPLSYRWTFNGTAVGGNVSNYTRNFTYFSAGNHVVRVNVSNDRYEHFLWTWNLTVRNVNRAPLMTANLTSPLTVNNSVTYINYFLYANGTQTFIDPDDDLDSDGEIDGNESNTLTFSTNGTCAVASLSIVGSDLTVTGSDIGNCTTYFIATDLSGATVLSNNVSITITDLNEGSTETVTTVSSGGGGGRSTTSTYIPLNKKLETPKAFHLITPKLMTIYNNKSVEIPITINNSWSSPLKFLRLSATSNTTGMNMSFSADFFEEIPLNGTADVTLTVTNYRLGGNYEIMVSANTSEPQYQDESLILLNSIEQSRDGDDVSVKVTFANDLLNEHPECQELNEVLDQAKERIAEGDLAQGSALVDGVINGCKYLVSTRQNIQEKPTRINPVINIDDLSVRAVMLGVLTFVVLSSIAFLIYYHYTHKPEDDI